MYPASAILLPLSKVVSSVGTMSTLFAGALMLRCSLATVVAGAMPPVGSPNTFVEISLVATNEFVGFPAVELAPVSLISDGMVPSIMPCISLAFERTLSLIFCFWCAFSQGYSSVGTTSTLFVGDLMLIRSLATVVDGAVPPVGIPNNLLDFSLVTKNGSVVFQL